MDGLNMNANMQGPLNMQAPGRTNKVAFASSVALSVLGMFYGAPALPTPVQKIMDMPIVKWILFAVLLNLSMGGDQVVTSAVVSVALFALFYMMKARQGPAKGKTGITTKPRRVRVKN